MVQAIKAMLFMLSGDATGTTECIHARGRTVRQLIFAECESEHASRRSILLHYLIS
jgi:hypothetical protein